MRDIDEPGGECDTTLIIICRRGLFGPMRASPALAGRVACLGEPTVGRDTSLRKTLHVIRDRMDCLRPGRNAFLQSDSHPRP